MEVSKQSNLRKIIILLRVKTIIKNSLDQNKNQSKIALLFYSDSCCQTDNIVWYF